MNTTNALTDEQALRKVLQGEREAFATIVARYLPALHAAAMARLQNAQDAEDVAQESFLKAYQSLSTLRDLSKFGPWLLTIARNACANLVRRQRRDASNAAVPTESPAPDLEKQERAEMLHRQILALDEDKREVLLMHYFAGMSLDEMAQALGIRRSAVAKRLQRARDTLGIQLLREAEGIQPYRVTKDRIRKVMAAITALPPLIPVPTPYRPPLGARLAHLVTAKSAVLSVVIAVTSVVGVIAYQTSGEPSGGVPQAKTVVPKTAQPTTKPGPAFETHPIRPAKYSTSAKASEGSAEPGKQIRGVVLDPMGQPIAEARVEAAATPRHRGGALFRTTTDSEGKYLFVWRQQTPNLSISAGKYESAWIECGAMPLDADVKITTSLFGNSERVGAPRVSINSNRGTITGTVRDHNGRPLEGVLVTLEGGGADKSATTGPDGAYQIQAPSGTAALKFELKGFVPAAAEVTPDSRLINMRMSVGGALRVRVTKGGQPVPGQAVQISGVHRAVVATNDQGVALFEHLPTQQPYSVSLVDAKEPYTQKGRTSVDEGGISDCELQIAEECPGTLYAQVLNKNGRPAKGIEYWVQLADEPTHLRRGKVNDDGTFEAGLSIGTNRVYLDAVSVKRAYPGQRCAEPPFEVVVDETHSRYEHTFHLKAYNPHLTVHLVDESGRPVTSASIVIVPGLQGPHTQFLVRATAGQFTILRDGLCSIYAYDPVRRRAGSVAAPDGKDSVEVRLVTATGSIHGRVQDEDGRPVAMANVGAYLRSGPAGTSAIQLLRQQTTSNQAGQFTLNPLALGCRYWLDVGCAGYALVSIRPGKDFSMTESPADFVVVMRKADATVAGRVVDDSGAPFGKVQVQVSTLDNHYFVQTYTDDDGRFTTQAPSGACIVVARQALLSSEPFTVNAPANGVSLVLPRQTKSDTVHSAEVRQARDMLKQVGLAYKIFAAENKEKYPALSHTYGQFSPDLGQLYPEYITDPTFADLLGGKSDVKTCYLGYLVNDEKSGMRFLDAYEQLGPQGLENPDTLQRYRDSINANGQQSIDPAIPLREGVERFAITDINNPAAGATAQSTIPVTWEMPGPERPDGGWVLYMDGHVEWRRYPGKFPMTEEFINRLKQIMASKSR